MIGRLAAVLGLAFAITLSIPVTAGAQDQTAPPATQPSNPPAGAAQAAADLERIKAQLNRAPVLKLDDNQLRFYVEVIGKQPSIADVIGSYDLINGPTRRGAPMTHQEFLDIVTPTDVRGYAAFDNRQGLIVAATSFALKWAVQKALDKLDQAQTERQKEAARKEVDEALAALRKARHEAGLPDR